MSRDASREIDVLRLQDGAAAEGCDRVAVEEPLEIRLSWSLDGRRQESSISVTMRTPGEDFELAAGFLFTEGIIRSAADISSIRECGAGEAAGNIVRVELGSEVSFSPLRLQRNFYAASSCGICGKASLDAIATHASPVTEDALQVTQEVLYSLPEKLGNRQEVFASTGGLHASALFDSEGALVTLREDVGRHNALDKVIGRHLLDGEVPLHRLILLVSGRASFELVQKAASAGIPILAAIGAPSSLAVEAAARFNVTIAGFLRHRRCNIYSVPSRVISRD